MPTLSVNKVKKLYYEEKLSVFEVAQILQKHPKSVFKFMGKNGLARRSAAEMNRIRFERKPLSFSIKQDLLTQKRN
ncbi:hypothetical protein KJ616_02435 [Patescibacteria group bacterium]|nr:hypothetical protein [Patescibacteria group bacterium]